VKRVIRLLGAFCTFAGLALTAWAGPEAGGKEMKQVAPAPAPECNWTGFYVGVHVGGEWGHSEDTDFDWNFGPSPFAEKPWGYDESGVVAGGQIGYNYQWHWLVVGIEGDLGYMNLDGSGVEPGSLGGDTVGKTESDFYTTIDGRLGFAFGKWLFYGMGGAIGVNYDKRVVDDCDTGPCGPGLIDAHEKDFTWGWNAGGGIEYMFNCHWTIKVEYLRFELDRDTFSAVATAGPFTGDRFSFDGKTAGNIVRAGLNYKF
jgi:outer membrane immunogenic protein